MDQFLQGISLVAQVFALAAFLAVIVERLVEHFIKPLLARAGQSWLAPYAALVLGAAVSLAFGIDVFSPIATAVGVEMTAPWAGLALSALVVGGGSQFMHDIWPSGK